MAGPQPSTLGRYEIEGPLAQGGMAELFVARMAGPDGFSKRVVIKRVLPALARERGFMEMFLHEARVAASLDHRNIVAVYDIGGDEASVFLAMELLHGADVGSLLGVADAELPLPVVLDIVCGACAGLHYAHERQTADGASLGLVHRDVSPQNLFVTFDGSTKLLDFGIAKAVDKIADRATRTGTVRGKVPYMSPEQCRAEPLDRRSDVFSLGIVLWELCVGERLYGAGGEGDFEIFKQIVERDAPLLRSRRASCPVELENIVARALQRERTLRYQTAAALQDDLEALVRSSALTISPREVGAFVARLFPAREEAWRRGERVAKAASDPPPGVRATVELHSSGLSEPMAVEDRPVPLPEPRRHARRWLGFGVIAVTLVAVGFLVGRRTPATTPVVTPATSAEDAHWLQPDDFLISETPYRDGRLDGLRVAKLLGEIDHATNIGRFLDGNASERATASYWKSHVARIDELRIGTRAACRADSWMLASAGPQDRAESRTQNWMLARITDIAERAAGRVTIGDVVCQVTGVRIVE